MRARLLLAPGTGSRSALARDLRQRDGVPIGEVYRFLSSLYFRGKLAYARRFARPPPAPPPAPPSLPAEAGGSGGSWLASGVLVITPSRGLLPESSRVCLEHLEEFREVPIDPGEPRFCKPLERDATLLRDALGPAGEAVLLGSVATTKYTAPLARAFGDRADRLRFPRELLGRGDMSRGGLLLRCVESGTELTYDPLQDKPLRGTRPAKLAPRRRT